MSASVAPLLAVLAASLAVPAATLAAGGDVLWTVPVAGAAGDDAVACPVAPGGSVSLLGVMTAGGSPQTFALRETADRELVWSTTLGGGLDGGAWAYASACDTRNRRLALVAGVKDVVHGRGIAVEQVDAQGKVLWLRSYAGYARSNVMQARCAVDSRGAVYVAGTTWNEVLPFLTEVFLVKYSPRGEVVWERTWLRGQHEVHLEGLVVTPAGRAYCGVAREFLDGGEVKLASTVHAFAGNGKTVWSRTFAGASGNRRLRALTLAPGGMLIAAGGRFARDNAGVVEKYDAAGRRRWRRSVATGSTGDGFLAVAAGRDGRVYASGASAFPEPGGAGPYVVALRPSGKVLWRSQWPHEGWGQRIAVAGTRVYVAAALSDVDPADHDVLGVECLSATDGSARWRREYDPGGAPLSAEVNDLTVVRDRSVFVAARIDDGVRGYDGIFLRLQP